MVLSSASYHYVQQCLNTKLLTKKTWIHLMKFICLRTEMLDSDNIRLIVHLYNLHCCFLGISQSACGVHSLPEKRFKEAVNVFQLNLFLRLLSWPSLYSIESTVPWQYSRMPLQHFIVLVDFDASLDIILSCGNSNYKQLAQYSLKSHQIEVETTQNHSYLNLFGQHYNIYVNHRPQ